MLAVSEPMLRGGEPIIELLAVRSFPVGTGDGGGVLVVRHRVEEVVPEVVARIDGIERQPAVEPQPD